LGWIFAGVHVVDVDRVIDQQRFFRSARQSAMQHSSTIMLAIKVLNIIKYLEICQQHCHNRALTCIQLLPDHVHSAHMRAQRRQPARCGALVMATEAMCRRTHVNPPELKHMNIIHG
jgi:hypothetical protein